MSTKLRDNSSSKKDDKVSCIGNQMSLEQYVFHFFVIFNKEGVEMMSLRKNFVDEQKVLPEGLISIFPGYTIRTIEVDYSRYAEGFNSLHKNYTKRCQ